MIINWYPGHMDKAIRMIDEQLDIIDLVVYVLDSRAPFSCVNPSFTSILGNKPIIYVLNKADLVEENALEMWKSYFCKSNTTCIILNSTESNSTKKLLNAVNNLKIKKIERNAKRGITIPLRMMIIGVPNSGKSTLINNLCKKGKTITGDKAGVTRGKQWVTVSDNLEVLDTPGTLWPDLDNAKVAHNLAYIGSIKAEALDVSSLVLDFLIDIILMDKTALENRYNIKIDTQNNSELIEELKLKSKEKDIEYENEIYENEDMKIFALSVYENICQKRGFILKNKDFDYERCAIAILDDFRKGRLGKIILEVK